MPKRKKWSEDDINKALEMINDGEKISKACKECDVPRSTICDRLKKGKPNKTGPKPLMTKYEEDELVKYIKYMSQIGQAVTQEWIRETAARMISCRYMF